MYYRWGIPCHDYFTTGGGFWTMGIIGLALVLIVLYFIYKNSKDKSESNYTNSEKRSSKNEALEILNRKFANGEISEEEYLRKRTILKDDDLN